MSITIWRNLAGVTGLKELFNAQLMPREFHVLSSKGFLLVDDFDREAIRQKIYQLYQYKEHVTLTKLLLTLKRDNIFCDQRSTLNIVLREMGFKWVTLTYVLMPINTVLYRHKRVDDKRHYYEQPHIMEQRYAYLHRMRNNCQENRPVVFLDEAWANAHDDKDCAWVERDDVTGGTLGGIKTPPGKGAWLIILGASRESGWIPNTTFIFRSKNILVITMISNIVNQRTCASHPAVQLSQCDARLCVILWIRLNATNRYWNDA